MADWNTYIRKSIKAPCPSGNQDDPKVVRNFSSRLYLNEREKWKISVVEANTSREYQWKDQLI